MARNHFAVFRTFMESPQVADADDTALATWLRLAYFCGMQLNGGRVADAKKLTERGAMRLCGVTLAGIRALVDGNLGCYEGNDLLIAGHDQEGEDQWKALSERNSARARARWRGPGNAGGADGDAGGGADDAGKDAGGGTGNAGGNAVDGGGGSHDNAKPKRPALPPGEPGHGERDAPSGAERSEAERGGATPGTGDDRAHAHLAGFSGGSGGGTAAPAVPPGSDDDLPVVLFGLPPDPDEPPQNPPGNTRKAAPPDRMPGALPDDAKESLKALADELAKHGLDTRGSAVDQWAKLLTYTAKAATLDQAFDALHWIVVSAREEKREPKYARLVGDLAHAWRVRQEKKRKREEGH